MFLRQFGWLIFGDFCWKNSSSTTSCTSRQTADSLEFITVLLEEEEEVCLARLELHL
jgi:hypothetical protein